MGSLWWAVITITTVGYGSKITTVGYDSRITTVGNDSTGPLSSGGKFMTAVAGICGVFLYGFAAAILVSRFRKYLSIVQHRQMFSYTYLCCARSAQKTMSEEEYEAMLANDPDNVDWTGLSLHPFHLLLRRKMVQYEILHYFITCYQQMDDSLSPSLNSNLHSSYKSRKSNVQNI